MNTEPCPVCTKYGLPVMPARYTVVPEELNVRELSFSGERVVDVPAQGVKYAARVLRQGYLYVYYEKNHLGAKRWQVYSVSPEGKLHRQSGTASARLVDKTEVCSRCGSAGFNKDFFVIEEPQKCATTWLAFSEHKWSDAIVQRYQDDAGLRARRMQKIEPAQWLDAAVAKNHQLILALPENLGVIVEYNDALGWNSLTNEPETFPCEGYVVAPPAVHGDGRFDVDWLRQRSSLYRWSRRSAPDGATAEGLFNHMMAACGGEHANHWPMMVALWDAVGTTHELNGFRNDVLGRFTWFSDAHERHIHAMQSMEAGKVAVEQGAQNRAGQTELWLGIDAGDPYGRAHLLVPFLEHARRDTPALGEYEQMRAEYVSGDIDFQQFQTRRARMDAEYASQPGKLDEALRYDEERLHRRREEFRQQQEKAVGKAWDRYEKRIVRRLLDAFIRNFDSLNQWRERLLGDRTPALKAWLATPLFLDTLEDYDKQNEQDGRQFNIVIEEALSGLEGDPEGRKVLQALVDNIDATDPASLVWRAVALNQSTAAGEVKAALAQADSRRDLVVTAVVGALDGAIKSLKSLAGLYVAYDAGGTSRVRPLEHYKMLALGVDKLMGSVGTLVFEKWRVGAVSDYFGEKLVQYMLSLRLTLDPADSRALIETQLRHESRLRTLYLEQVGLHQSQGRSIHQAADLAMAAVVADRGTQELRQRWQSLRLEHTPKMAMLAALCETVGMFKLMFKADKSRADWALLGASAMSTAAAYSQVMLGPMAVLLGERSRTLTNWKALGGGLAAGASLIQVVVDISELRREIKSGYILVGALFVIKAIVGIAVSGAFFVTALSSSGHLLQRMVGRNGVVVVLERIDDGIARAAKERAAQALGHQMTTQAGKKVLERGLYVSIGRSVLMLVGWKVTVVIMVVQGAIWYFSPDELERWIDKTPFGHGQQFTALKHQQAAHDSALKEMGLQ